jgi:hypothetical protein
MMEYPFLQSEQLGVISSRVKDWLVALQRRASHTANFTLKNALQILVGLWICERALLDAEEFSYTKSQAQEVCQDIAPDTDIFTHLLHFDPPLVLLSTGILRFCKLRNEGLELFAEKISQLLQEHRDQDEAEANELFITRFLLHGLHLHPTLTAYSLPEISANDLILADDDATKALIINITAATQYGQVTLSAEEASVKPIHSILPILTIDYFRAYNLELGMQLLRCMRYLNLCENPSFYTSLNFLIAQQQPDGRLGFLAREITLSQISQEHFGYDLNIFLPHTVSFLWTIAEATNSQFILPKSF